MCHQVSEDIGLILFNTVNYYLNKVIPKPLIKVKHRHEKKLVNLRQQKRKVYGERNTLFTRSTVHNCSSYNLSIEEEKVLSFGLEQHIPTTLNRNNLHTEFEYFHKNITDDISHLSKNIAILKFRINARELLTPYDEITAL